MLVQVYLLLPVLLQCLLLTLSCLLSTMLKLFCFPTKSYENISWIFLNPCDRNLRNCFQKLKRATTLFCHFYYFCNTFQVWQHKPFAASETRKLWLEQGQDDSICELHRLSAWMAQLKKRRLKHYIKYVKMSNSSTLSENGQAFIHRTTSNIEHPIMDWLILCSGHVLMPSAAIPKASTPAGTLAEAIHQETT